jgi:hypothetical protein
MAVYGCGTALRNQQQQQPQTDTSGPPKLQALPCFSSVHRHAAHEASHKPIPQLLLIATLLLQRKAIQTGQATHAASLFSALL